MSGESFEWAIKKDVRNNPIVREVDLERHREMWRSVGISVFLVTVLLISVWQQVMHRQYGRDMELLQERLAEETVTQRRLRLELETYQSPQWVKPIATKKLDMVVPRLEDTVVIERVVEPQAAPKSVLASR